MFLFLMLTFMVAWALSLVIWTQIVSRSRDYKGQAEKWGPFSIGSPAGWVLFHSRLWRLVDDGTPERCVLAGWSFEPRGAMALAFVARLATRHATDWIVPTGSNRREEVGYRLLSLAR